MKKFFIIVCIFMISISCYIYKTANENWETSKKDQYEEMQEVLKGKSFSSLDIFPKRIKDTECTYYAKCKRKYFDFEVQQYLLCDYAENEFKAELERLSNLEVVDEQYNLHHSIVYDTESFCYPAYIMTFRNNYCYEYALVDDQKQRIIYIYLQHAQKVRFNNYYLDKEYKNYIESGYSEKGYDQYAFSSEEIEAAEKDR